MVPVGENASFAVREFDLPRFTSPWHLHDEYELTLILSGTGKRFVGDSVSPYAVGDLVLIGSNLPHYWRSDQTGRRQRSHSIVIQFRQNSLGEDFFDRPELRQIKNLLLRCRRGIRFFGNPRKVITGKMLAIRKAAGLQRVQEFLSILDLLARTKEYRLLAGEGFLETSTGWRDERISRACQYVFDHLGENLSLKDISRVAAMSPESFCRFFRKMTGQTLFSFINRIRVGHACALLIGSALNISEAGYASGFSNLSNFNRRFRQIKGVNPRQFRRQFQESA